MKFIIVITIVIILLYIWYSISTLEDYMYGFWVADGDKFCSDSNIDSMMVFIGRDNNKWPMCSNRDCYIIIMNNLCNQGFAIEYRSSLRVGTKYSVVANVHFDDEDIWPKTIKIDIDMRYGTMVISADDMVYAKLNKQHDITNLVRELDAVAK